MIQDMCCLKCFILVPLTKTRMDAFQKEESSIRVLVATIAFGMGVDCKGVHPKTLKRIFRRLEWREEMENSVAYLIYQGLFLNHVDKDIKQYVRETDCRRKTLLHKFDGMSPLTCPQPLHMCCNNCSVRCEKRIVVISQNFLE